MTPKSFDIPKTLIWEAYKHVKVNGGAAGIDQQTIEQFEEHLGDNLYKLWNRMCSGSYLPPPGQSCTDSEEIRWRSGAGYPDAPGIMHLIQFALGMPGGDDLSSRPNLAAVDRRRRRF